MINVLFLPGLEGGVNGKKSRLLNSIDSINLTVVDYGNPYNIYVSYQKVLTEMIKNKFDIIIASSYGTSIIVYIIQIGLWTGRTILLSSAVGIMLSNRLWLPENYPNKIIFVHGNKDSLCNIESIDQFAKYPYVRIYKVNDGHKLSKFINVDKLKILIDDVSFGNHKDQLFEVSFFNYWTDPLVLLITVLFSLLYFRLVKN